MAEVLPPPGILGTRLIQPKPYPAIQPPESIISDGLGGGNSPDLLYTRSLLSLFALPL